MKIAFISAYNELNINQAMFYSESRLGIDLFAGLRLARKKLQHLGHMVFSPYNFSAFACCFKTRHSQINSIPH